MKVVIIGLGSIAKKHINALKELYPLCVFYGLRHNKDAKTYKDVINIYEYYEILEIKPDFIIISNPTINHLETLEVVSEYNIPLFIEKPVFSSVGDKEKKLVEKIINSKVANYIACNLRFHSGLLKMKELLKNERIEEVNAYCGSYLPKWRPDANFREVYSANKEQGGGVHIDLIHELDYLYWFFGNPIDVKSVLKSQSSLDITAIDYACYLLDYNTFCANVTLNYFRKDSKRILEVLTSKGTYFLDLLQNEILFDNEAIFKSNQDLQTTYLNQMKFFVESVIKSNSNFNTIEEGYNILKICI